MIKKTTVTKKWRTTQKDGKVVSENFNQKRTKKSKKYATKKSGYPLTVTLQNTHVRIHKREAGVFCSIWYLRAMMGAFDQIWWERFWRPRARVIMSWSLFSRFFLGSGGSFSLFFFCISLFFASRARALCLSFSSSFADDNAPGWRRRFGDALDDDDENHSALNVCVDVQKDGWLRSESWTDAFLFVSTLNKACVGKKRKERERIDFRWRWWWEILYSYWNQRDWFVVIWAKRYISLVY